MAKITKKKIAAKKQPDKTGFNDKKTKKSIILPKAISSPVKAYTINMGRSRAPSLQWEAPEWNLGEMGRIVDTEALCRRAFKNKKNLFLKEGYSFTGNDPVYVNYIRTRFRQMEVATGIPFPMLMAQSVASLIRTGNAIWVKVRKEESSGGKKRVVSPPDAKVKKTLDPVAGYFPLPIETIQFKRDAYGKIKKYQQVVPGKEPNKFNPEDIIHFTFERREGFAVGTPDLIAVKDDIRALRRIEENVELLVYNHLFPLFHYQVGTEDNPAANFPDGTSEVDIVRAEVAAMPSDSCWVTPERHKISVLGAQGQALAAEKILEYFKNRVIVGLGNSVVDMGEGSSANRSTAQTMSRVLIDDIKAAQKEFGAQFFTFVIQELMLESTFSTKALYDDDKRVHLKFNEIDIEARNSKENHLADLFNKNAITHTEMRVGMGHKPFVGTGFPNSKGDGDWANTNYGIIGRDEVVLQSLDEPGTPTAKAEAKSRTTANKSKGSSNGAVSNKNQPVNQHGKRSSAKVNKDMELAIETYFNITLANIDNGRADKKATLSVFDSVMKDAEKRFLRDLRFEFKKGYESFSDTIPEHSYSSEVQASAVRKLNWFRDTTKTIIDKSMTWNKKLKNQEKIIFCSVTELTLKRLKSLVSSELKRACLYGELSAIKKHDLDINMSLNRDNCEKCVEKSFGYEKSNDIIYEELPPFYSGCTCKLNLGDEN